MMILAARTRIMSRSSGALSTSTSSSMLPPPPPSPSTLRRGILLLPDNYDAPSSGPLWSDHLHRRYWRDASMIVPMMQRRNRPSRSILRSSSSSSSSPSSSSSNVIPASMASARTIEEVLSSIEEQRRTDEERRAMDRPRPWYGLLRHPSGASWRSTDRVLGSSVGIDDAAEDDVEDSDADVDDTDESGGGRRRGAGGRTSVLSRTRFNLLRRSERTNKQLRRTYKRILEVQKALSIKRERERRLAANSLRLSSSSFDSEDGNDHDGGYHGDMRRSKRQSIEDGRGRRVGDWREKKGGDRAATPRLSPILCEDPSVAMSLSIGLKSASSSAAVRRMRRDAMMNNNDDENEYDGGCGGGGGGARGGLGATDYYYADNEAARASTMTTSAKSAKVAGRIAAESGYAGGDTSTAASRKPVAYGPEQAMTNMKYRFGTNYSIVRRVLMEVQSLLGGRNERGGRDDGQSAGGGRRRKTFRPRRVLDFGSGVGSSGAAALDVFGVGRSGGGRLDGVGGARMRTLHDANEEDGIDWIHSIDASQCMRETTEKVLKSMLERSPWEGEVDGGDDVSYLEEEEMSMLAEYERSLFDDGGRSNDKERKRLDRRRRRMERWEQTWEKRTDFRTRLTFSESIVDASTAASSPSSTGARTQNGGWYDVESDGEGVDNNNNNNRRRLPWQDQLDEQRRGIVEPKKQGEQQQQDRQQKNKGSFDLILCSYTLSELPSVPASLAAAALLWEKLAPEGVLVFVEPGTPDGFGTLRSVRSMLLECCPPPEVKARRRRERVAAMAAIKLSSNEKEADNDDVDDNDDGDIWPEECHVIAPCTHNGTCPMSRHQRNHIKHNTRFAKYETAEPKEDDEDDGSDDEEKMEGGMDDDEESSFQDLLDEWDDMSDEDKEEIKKMLGGGEDMSDDDAKAMLEYMDSMDSDDEDEEDEDDEDNEQDLTSVNDVDDHDVGDNQEYYNIVEGANRNEPSSKKSSIIAKTDVFGTSFCSFVHNFPGGTTRKRGEKFTYLVVQKRVPDLKGDEHSRVQFNAVDAPSNHTGSLDEIDIVEMLSKSVHHAQKLKRGQLQERLRLRRHSADGDDESEEEIHAHSYHRDQYNQLLRRAVEVEDQFLESTIDSLGLEMLHGDKRRRGWGRLIRAPLKRRGHVLLDYCSAGCGGDGGNGGCSDGSTDEGIDSATTYGNDGPDGTQGRITRQKVSRGWSARSAPGCYSAARKARWGGLWPDLSERVKSIEREDKEIR
ncbi:hypothetical protein ACHAXA_004655 [Cyclostephanos tholiformis]|uniref:Uncharacterized protein n=1 Tax=Cyclostephanos tholiformis TaxID=382380 RepID=A0ABD3RFM3_9STRA